jgi:glycosyltransferase involved in cell wall biosynthesis
LVEAFRLLGGVNVKLLIAGDGPLAESLAGHPFVERIPFQHDLSQVWNRFDIVVQPSTEPDAFPRSVIEAMSHARPVVGSRTGGIPEAIEDGVTGFTFQPGDAPALADRLRVLIADATLRAAMGEAARKRCESMFTVERQIRRLTGIYRRIAAASAHAV